MTFQNFCVGESNRLAYSAAICVAEKPAAGCNPLVLLGPSGVGKTHLLYAIANRARELHPDLKIVHINIREFVDELVSTVRTRSTEAFREKYRSVDMLLLDNIEFLSGKKTVQEALFAVVDGICQSGKQVVLAQGTVFGSKTLERYIETRLHGGLVASIELPDREVKREIAKRKAEEYGLELTPEVYDLIADDIYSDGGLVGGMVKRLRLYAFLTKEEATRETVRKILENSERTDTGETGQ